MIDIDSISQNCTHHLNSTTNNTEQGHRQWEMHKDNTERTYSHCGHTSELEVGLPPACYAPRMWTTKRERERRREGVELETATTHPKCKWQ
jgi:hypothetical protein